MRPTVSVVMPTRGRPDYVERAIKSVLKQSFSDFELLILDNSTQLEKQKIQQISSRDSRIVFVDRGNIGVTKARKLGASLSRGKLLALLDSDDYWDAKRLERHVRVWREYRIGLSWDRWARASETGLIVVPQPFSPGLIPPPKVAVRLYVGNFIHASAGIVSSVFARALGFPAFEVTSSDWTLFMRASEYYPAFFIGETLSFNEARSPDRVSEELGRDFLRKEMIGVRRWALLSRPKIYGPGVLKRRLDQFLGKIALRKSGPRHPSEPYPSLQ